MRAFLLFASFAISIHAAAAPATKSVSLKMDLNVDAQTMSSTAKVAFGEKATVTKKIDSALSYALEVTPTAPSPGQIAMSFVVTKIERGTATVIGSPKITTKDGEAAEVRQSSEGHALNLAVTPTIN